MRQFYNALSMVRTLSLGIRPAYRYRGLPRGEHAAERALGTVHTRGWPGSDLLQVGEEFLFEQVDEPGKSYPEPYGRTGQCPAYGMALSHTPHEGPRRDFGAECLGKRRRSGNDPREEQRVPIKP
jgi:hypothetical protein